MAGAPHCRALLLRLSCRGGATGLRSLLRGLLLLLLQLQLLRLLLLKLLLKLLLLTLVLFHSCFQDSICLQSQLKSLAV